MNANLKFSVFFVSISWDGMGWDGVGGQKCPLIFLILNKLVQILKKCPDKFPVGLKIWTSWGSEIFFQKHPLGWIFLNRSKSQLFYKKY